jgi:hypothetical protein
MLSSSTGLEVFTREISLMGYGAEGPWRYLLLADGYDNCQVRPTSLTEFGMTSFLGDLTKAVSL